MRLYPLVRLLLLRDLLEDAFSNWPPTPTSTRRITARTMQFIKGLAIAAIAAMMCFAPTTATASVDVKKNTPEERKLYYERTPITKSPYNRVIPTPPPLHHN